MSDHADDGSDRRQRPPDIALRRNKRALANNATSLSESVPDCGSKRRVTAAVEVPDIESWDNGPKQATHFVRRLPACGGSDQALSQHPDALRIPAVKRPSQLRRPITAGSA
jgi:hypothetical protein